MGLSTGDVPASHYLDFGLRRALAILVAIFWRPVSASKIPFPAGLRANCDRTARNCLSRHGRGKRMHQRSVRM